MIGPHDGGTSAREHLVLPSASVLVAAALFLPRPLNFAPLGAFGLFSGAYAPRRRAWIYPLSALAVYVAAIGGYHWFVLGSVFLGFAGPAVLGSCFLRGRTSLARIGGSALASSAWFFLVSNLGSWIAFGVPRGESLLHHYVLGVPFLWNTVAGDLFFSAVLFGGYAWVRSAARDRSGCRKAA